jgi:hypothetical protein
MTRSADESTNQGSSTRREFAKSLAALAAIPLLGSGKARAETEGATPTAANLLSTIVSPVPQGQAPEKPLPEAEALAEVAKIQYGKYLNDDQMAEIKRSLSGRFRAAEAMKKTKLANGDEPAFIFSANP